MGFNVGKAFKKVGKALKNPVNWTGIGAATNLALGALGQNSLKPNNVLQMGLMAGAGFLVGGPVGAALGAGLSFSQQGYLGRNIQDIATMGASAQVRYNEKMASAYNKAQQQQAKIAELNNERNLLQQIRAARIARSMNLSDYAGETNVFTSGAIGNLGSVGSQYLSNATYSVATGNLANAYQTYMNQYNWYQTQARNSQIRWNNRMNTIKTGLSIFGMGDNLNTARLNNFYARMRLNDAWADACREQSTLKQVPNYNGEYFSFVR